MRSGSEFGAVDIAINDRYPVFGEVARQFGLHARVVDGDRGREDQRTGVTLLPQAVDDGGHEAQDAARALERHQGRPVGVEPVKDLGVDGVSRLNAPFVVDGATFGRELALLRLIQLGRRRGAVTLRCVRLSAAKGSKRRRRTISKPSSALARAPGRFDATDHVAEAIKRFASTDAAQLPRRRPGR